MLVIVRHGCTTSWAGWTSTTTCEQADAAAQLRRLGLAPAIVFGTGTAAGILADLCLRHPHVLQGAIFREPVFPPRSIGHRRHQRRAPGADGRRNGQGRPARGAGAEPARRGGRCGLRVARSAAARTANWATPRSCSVSRWLPSSPTTPHPASSQRYQCPPYPAVTAGVGNRESAAAGHWRYQAAQWLAAPFQTNVTRPARGADGLPRPARTLRHSTAADTGQPHPTRTGRARADQTTKRRTRPGAARLSALSRATCRALGRAAPRLGWSAPWPFVQ